MSRVPATHNQDENAAPLKPRVSWFDSLPVRQAGAHHDTVIDQRTVLVRRSFCCIRLSLRYRGHVEGKVLVCVFVFQPHPCLPAGRPHPSPLRRRGELFVCVVLLLQRTIQKTYTYNSPLLHEGEGPGVRSTPPLLPPPPFHTPMEPDFPLEEHTLNQLLD